MSKSNVLSLVGIVLLAVAAWAVYGRALEAPFIFDDTFSITDNSSIVRICPLVGDSPGGPLNPPRNLPTSGRPLVNLSLALNYHFGGLDPAGYHVFNLIVHVLSAILLMAIVRRTLCLQYFAGRFTQGSLVAPGLAFVAALLWTLHPLQTETVIYITQRSELMVGFFYLATLYASLRYWGAMSAARRNIWLILATGACFAGMACKEVMVTAPVIVLLFERTFISPGAPGFRRALKHSWPLYLGLFLSWGLLIALNLDIPRSDTAGFHLGLPAYAWWLTQTKVLWMYLKLTFWPWPLAIHYEMPYLETIGAAWPWALPALLLGIATIALFWRRNAIGFVGACVFVILSPTLIVPVLSEVAAERRMYLPLAALVVLLVVGGYCLAQRASRMFSAEASRRSAGRWSTGSVATTALVVAVVFSVVDVRRLAAYHDSLTLWQDLLATDPDDAKAHNNLAVALFEAGQGEEAITHIREALRLNPEFNAAHYNFGLVLSKSGRTLEAIEQYQESLRLKPNYPEARNSLGLALVSVDRLSEAIEQYQRAVQLKPDFAEAHFNLGVALGKAGQWAEAVEQYQLALKLQHDYPLAHNNLAGAYVQLQRPADAIATAQQALGLARSQGEKQRIEEIEHWLNAYRAAQAEAPSGSSSTVPSSTSP